jgi:hypothetical protein
VINPYDVDGPFADRVRAMALAIRLRSQAARTASGYLAGHD